MSNICATSMVSRQHYRKIFVLSSAGLLLLAAMSALSAHFGADYWNGRMLIAFAFLPL